MTSWLVGGLLGLLAASGVALAIRAAPPMRPIRLVDRVAPYLSDTAPPSKLLARPSASSTPFAVARRLSVPRSARRWVFSSAWWVARHRYAGVWPGSAVD